MMDSEHVAYKHFKDENDEEITIINRSDEYPDENISEKPRWVVGGKKRGRPSGKGSNAKEWQDSEIYLLVELWEKKDVLYNTKHVLYYNKEERDTAIRDIHSTLKEQSIFATMDQIIDKMTNLKCYYGSQKRNMENMKLTGADENYISPWKFFNHLNFLNGHFLQRTPTTRRRYIVNHQQMNVKPLVKIPLKSNGHHHQQHKQQQQQHQFPYEGAPAAKVTIVDPYIVHTPKASMVDPYLKSYASPVGAKNYSSHSPIGDNNGYWNDSPHPKHINPPSSYPITNGGPINGDNPKHSPGSLASSVSANVHKLKTEDDCFCELMCKMLNQIPESEEKAMLRLEMQQKVIALRYRS